MNSPATHALRPQGGFTLIELITVVALLATLASLAAPGMQRLVVSQRLRSASYDLMADLSLARSEALKRGTQVSLSKRNSAWTEGWLVAVSGTTLGQRNSLGTNIQLVASPDTGAIFNANGRVNATTTVTFELRDTQYGGRRCVKLDLSGRPKSTTTSCS